MNAILKLMQIDDRDRQVLTYIARFKQLSSAQIRELVFSTSPSRTSADRCLRRLVEANLASRVDHRSVGGSKGGSGLYCYQLGSAAWHTYFEGRYQPWRTVNHHALAIADAYLTLVRLEREGRLKIIGYSTEPDCHITAGRYELKPDMFCELQLASSSMKLWLEVDLGSEGQRQIKGKLERYWQAFNEATSDDWPEWPRIAWITPDDHRAKELRWIISQGPSEAQRLFRVLTLDEFVHSFD